MTANRIAKPASPTGKQSPASQAGKGSTPNQQQNATNPTAADTATSSSLSRANGSLTPADIDAMPEAKFLSQATSTPEETPAPPQSGAQDGVQVSPQGGAGGVARPTLRLVASDTQESGDAPPESNAQAPSGASSGDGQAPASVPNAASPADATSIRGGGQAEPVSNSSTGDPWSGSTQAVQGLATSSSQPAPRPNARDPEAGGPSSGREMGSQTDSPKEQNNSGGSGRDEAGQQQPNIAEQLDDALRQHVKRTRRHKLSAVFLCNRERNTVGEERRRRSLFRCSRRAGRDEARDAQPDARQVEQQGVQDAQRVGFGQNNKPDDGPVA
ncbi:hypothetical protein HMPREF1624_03696 [Sporothrix schenckii ATCC 58251]|uniref:Uncharacterized protein n=1 Tax=Sporothrix schenckii (strain ATCC 58251 / de Perez 2211183) TaxID=1391915 RepID=U7Q004_SPOS1|nr:hypothetical protein HMPREF1624_03696 [Sporothrix schenckii ATCC 58251]